MNWDVFNCKPENFDSKKLIQYLTVLSHMTRDSEVDQALGLLDSVVQCCHQEPSFFPSLYPPVLGVGFTHRLAPKRFPRFEASYPDTNVLSPKRDLTFLWPP